MVKLVRFCKINSRKFNSRDFRRRLFTLYIFHCIFLLYFFHYTLTLLFSLYFLQYTFSLNLFTIFFFFFFNIFIFKFKFFITVSTIIHEQLCKLAAQSDTTQQIVNDICLCRPFGKPMDKEYVLYQNF